MTERGYDAVHHCCGLQEGGFRAVFGSGEGVGVRELSLSSPL